jgi:acyl-[acyl-carrier-protein]-phospholipid O-acyltransferase / long-chain-fatty-acid--[acyl-carrier-protein] ligase
MVTQFQGAFSDNVLKNLVVFIILGMSATLTQQHRIGELVGALFALPFILFSMTGGFLADKFSKRDVTIGIKIFEIMVMVFATGALMLHRMSLELFAVFLMGVHSAIFGPSKYGLLPELLPEKKLSWGNGLLELGTYTAIILGTTAAALMSKYFHHKAWSGIVLVVLAFAGLGASLGITRVRAADPVKRFDADFVNVLIRRLRTIGNDDRLTFAAAGNTYFSFLGQLLLLNLFFYGADTLQTDAIGIGKLTIALALGIGLGSVAAGYLSGGKIEYGLVPLGALGLSIFSALLAVPNLSIAASMGWLALLGFFGGFFIVPISALLQHRPEKTKRGEVLAVANWLSFVGILLASGAYYLLADVLKFSPRQIFLFGGGLTLIGAIWAIKLLPDALIRFVLWIFTRTLYRLRIEGRDNIPEKGGALFVCNHVSFVDALLLMASTDRRISFLMDKSYYELWWIRPFTGIFGIIPISSAQKPRELIHSLYEASNMIHDGRIVCIFAEGGITRTGELNEFRSGLKRIMSNVDAPIIPIALGGVWGSIFSFEGGKFFWKWPKKIPYPVDVKFGKPMPSASSPDQVREAVIGLLNQKDA